MTDFLGEKVKVGDVVLVVEKDYRNMKLAIVLSIAPKSIQVAYEKWGRLTAYRPVDFVIVHKYNLAISNKIDELREKLKTEKAV